MDDKIEQSLAGARAWITRDDLRQEHFGRDHSVSFIGLPAVHSELTGGYHLSDRQIQ